MTVIIDIISDISSIYSYRYSSDSLSKTRHMQDIRHNKFPQSSTMAIYQEPTSEDAIALFKEIEQIFPHKTLGDDKWYLVAVNFQTR
jgi:hypothetical protein